MSVAVQQFNKYKYNKYNSIFKSVGSHFHVKTSARILQYMSVTKYILILIHRLHYS